MRKIIELDKRINSEKKRLLKIYKSLDTQHKNIAISLIERAAFMRVQCEDLEKFLNENGWTEEFAQGNQKPYDRARPQGQSYLTLNANYQKIIKQLDAMLPPVETAVKSDGFDEFIGSRSEI